MKNDLITIQNQVPKAIKTALGWFCGAILALLFSIGAIAVLFNITYKNSEYILSVLKQNRYYDIQLNNVHQELKKTSKLLGYDEKIVNGVITLLQVEQDVTAQLDLANDKKQYKPDKIEFANKLYDNMKAFVQLREAEITPEAERNLQGLAETAGELYWDRILIPHVFWYGRGLQIFDKGVILGLYLFPFVLISILVLLKFICGNWRKIIKDLSFSLLVFPAIILIAWAVCKKAKPWQLAIDFLGEQYFFLDYLGTDILQQLYKTGLITAGAGFFLFIIVRRICRNKD